MASIQGIYVALFGRPVDPAGLTYWEGETKGGTDLSGMISLLSSTDEYQRRFEGQTDTQILTTIYASLFGRAPDAAGLAYFLEQLSSVAQTIETIVVNVLDGAKGDDAVIIEHKLDAADLFTTSIDTTAEIAAYTGDDAAGIARSYLSKVGLDASTVPTQTDADGAVQDLTPDATTPGTGGGGNAEPDTVTTVLDDIANPHVDGTIDDNLVSVFEHNPNLSAEKFVITTGIESTIELGLKIDGPFSGNAEDVDGVATYQFSGHGISPEYVSSVTSIYVADHNVADYRFVLSVDVDPTLDGVVWQTYTLGGVSGAWTWESDAIDDNRAFNATGLEHDAQATERLFVNASVSDGHYYFNVKLEAFSPTHGSTPLVGVYALADF